MGLSSKDQTTEAQKRWGKTRVRKMATLFPELSKVDKFTESENSSNSHTYKTKQIHLRIHHSQLQIHKEKEKKYLASCKISSAWKERGEEAT